MTNFLDMSATERAEAVNAMPLEKLCDWADVFHQTIPWDARSKALKYYPQIVCALTGRLRQQLALVDSLQERIEALTGPTLCADPCNNSCDCVPCQNGGRPLAAEAVTT